MRFFTSNFYTTVALTRYGTKIKTKRFKPDPHLQPFRLPIAPLTPRVLRYWALQPPSAQPISEQVWQNETWRFGLHTVDPEVCTAGVVLVSSVRQLEVVRFGIKGLKEGELKQVWRSHLLQDLETRVENGQCRSVTPMAPQGRSPSWQITESKHCGFKAPTITPAADFASYTGSNLAEI